MSMPLNIVRTALACSVGNSAPAACAAIRAGISVTDETRFQDRGQEWLRAAQIHNVQPESGYGRLAKILAAVVDECTEELTADDLVRIPLLLCLSEESRPGRPQDLETTLLDRLRELAGARFSPSLSAVVARGKVSGAVALAHARKLVAGGAATHVLVAAVDSLLQRDSLIELEAEDRLLTSVNSNGFIPGEAASAVLVAGEAAGDRVQCTGIGFGRELATITSNEPLRADGLVAAIRAALAEAQCDLADIHVRVSDLSGEHYYFRETALALSRLLRKPRETFPLWNPAECIGEIGAAVAPALMAVAHAAFIKGYSPGPSAILQFSNDSGERAAIVLQHVGA
jgi:3-oxoacyl-[acyl-carrier-protein] synthase-1